MISIEKNSRVFKGIGEMSKIRDRKIHYFTFLILDHNTCRLEDFGNVVHVLTDL